MVNIGDKLPLIFDNSVSKGTDILCKASSKEYQYDSSMGIRWGKLKHIPFVDGCSSSIVSGDPCADVAASSYVSRSCTPPLVETNVEWWDVEREPSFGISEDSFCFDNSFEYDTELFTSGNNDCESDDSGLSSMKKYSNGSFLTEELCNQLHT